MKYIIDLEKIDGTELYKAKGFNTLVFDEIGISKLERLDTKKEKSVSGFEIMPNEHFKTPNGSTIYMCCGTNSDCTKLNAVNIKNGNYVTLNINSNYVIVEEE